MPALCGLGRRLTICVLSLVVASICPHVKIGESFLV